MTKNNEFKLEIKEAADRKRYGIRIRKDEANPYNRIEYIHDAVGMKPAKMGDDGVFDYGDWVDIWFVKDNYPVMLNPDGTEAYKLNHNDYSLKEDGTPSDISDTTHDMNAMSRIPLVWLKQYEDDEYEYVIACKVKYDDTYEAFAHTDATATVKESLYLSIYKGTLVGEKLRSLSGQELMVSETSTQEVTYAKANGVTYDTRSWSQRNLINMLLFIMGKSDNTQSTFGNGNVDIMDKLISGTLDKMGQFHGDMKLLTKQVKVFHIEGWWGDIWERLNGLLNIEGVNKVKMTPPYNFTGTDFNEVGISNMEEGWIKGSKMSKFGRLPNVTTGASNSTYQTDSSYYTNTGIRVVFVGGGWASGTNAGASLLHLYALASYSSVYVGAGLSAY